MNEKPVKVDIDFNEALRRIANTPKGVIAPEEEQKNEAKAKKEAAPSKKKSAAKIN
jgi:hypothetical protein